MVAPEKPVPSIVVRVRANKSLIDGPDRWEEIINQGCQVGRDCSLRKSNLEIAVAQASRAGIRGGLGLLREQFGGRKQHFSTAFDQHAAALPLAHESAGGEMSDVGLVSQLFIVYVELHAFRNAVPDAGGEVDQHGGEALARATTGERKMQGAIEDHVVVSDQQGVGHEPGTLLA